MTEAAPDLVLDALGQRCPLPVILLAKRIGDVVVGGVISVLSDDPAAALDLPAWCGLRGQEFIGQRPSPVGGVGYWVRRIH